MELNTPYGGELVDLVATGKERDALLAEANTLPSLQMSDRGHRHGRQAGSPPPAGRGDGRLGQTLRRGPAARPDLTFPTLLLSETPLGAAPRGFIISPA